MANYGQHFSTRKTSQNEQASEKQQANNAGGFSFVVTPWERLDRFLVLGSESGTYYASEKKLTVDNAKNIQKLIAENGVRVVNRTVEISDQGRAPKNDQAIFVLAMCAGSDDQAVRQAAYAALPKVCRIGTHLLHFARDVEQFRGWSRGLRRAVANWYTERSDVSLANQVVKYQSRDGWSNRDLLRLSHPGSFGKVAPEKNTILQWVVARAETDKKKSDAKRAKIDNSTLSPFIKAFEEVQATDNVKRVVELVREFKLPREAIRTEHLNEKVVWEALLENMGTTALIRSLAKMTSIGLLQPMSGAAKKVADQITNEAILKKDRIHPMAMLLALKQYSSGHGLKGGLFWNPVQTIVDGLDSGFYTCFGNVEPTGKKMVLALDVSGSMSERIAGTNLSCREASAAMAMITARVEKDYAIIGFTSGGLMLDYRNCAVTPLNISPRQRLDNVIQSISNLPFGGTDCALPMIWAKENKIEADAFCIYTDSETWFGNIHPHQALREYRNFSGRPAKEIVVGMTATKFTIADPDDAGMMDVCGFDTAVPQIMSDFIKG
jgi:60 kDa SS-A/Ro ribonucleoprotein